VEIEWACVIGEFRESGTGFGWRIDLHGVNQDAITVDGGLPQEVPVDLAIMVRSPYEEVRDGGLITLMYTVTDPDGNPVWAGDTTFTAEPSPDVFADQTRHAVLPMTATVPMTKEGLYTIGVALPRSAEPYEVQIRLTLFPQP
jgi:hypothetical protein